MSNKFSLLRAASLALTALGMLDIIAAAWFTAATLMGSRCWFLVMFVSRELAMFTMLVIAVLALPRLAAGLMGLKAVRLNKTTLSCKVLGIVSLILELLYMMGAIRSVVWSVVKNLAVPSPKLSPSVIPILWSGIIVLALLGFLGGLLQLTRKCPQTQR